MPFTVDPFGNVFDQNSWRNDPIGTLNGNQVLDPLGKPLGNYQYNAMGPDNFWPDSQPYKTAGDQYDVYPKSSVLDPKEHLNFDPLDLNKPLDINDPFKSAKDSFKNPFDFNSRFNGGFNGFNF
ncbi:MAG: hypothetical protein JXR10_06805 [Cyclobacteriaceae bacterium]